MTVYFDENFSPHLVAGMSRFQDGRKSEGVSVTSVREAFGQRAADEVWIPGIASRHGIAVTQDLNLHRTRVQWALCQQNKIGIFFFRPPRKAGWGYWQIIQLVIRFWPELMSTTRQSSRPFGYVLDASKPNLIAL